MAGKPENKRQITMYIDAGLLEQVDEAAYQIRQRRNDRTEWILNAINEKLGNGPQDPRIVSIIGAFDSLDEAGREWLYRAALSARDGGQF